jgi:hypothetical protein
MEQQFFSSREIIPLGHTCSYPVYLQRTKGLQGLGQFRSDHGLGMHTHEQPSHAECTYTCIVHMGNKSYVNTNLINISARHYAQLHNL